MLGLVFACLILGANSGNIASQDLIMSPNNINTPSEFTLIFTLDSPLASTDYLRIVFPFSLTSLQPGLWDTYANCAIIGPGKLATVTASTITKDTTNSINAFFVQFYTDLTSTSLSGLSASVSYYLKFTATSSATAGIKAPVQVSTVSNNVNTDTYIIYDSNSVFGTLSVNAAYPTTMVVTSAVPSTETSKTVLGANYKVNIDFFPKTTIKNRARIDIKLDNSDFALLNCLSVDSASESITILPATFQALSANSIRATITSTLNAGNNLRYRFQCAVMNPMASSTSTITVKTLLGYQETVVDSGTDAVGLTAAAAAFVSPGWDESYHNIKLGWGYEASSPTALPVFAIYKDAGGETWYQSAKIHFRPKSDLTVIDKLQVVISTINDAYFRVLMTTIHHNLPDYSSTQKVACSVVTQGFLTCQNVGQLQGKTYHVSFRFNLQSSSPSSTAPDFGKVKIQTQAASPVTLIALSSTTLTYASIIQNPYLCVSNCIIASATNKASSPVTSTFVTNGEEIVLRIYFRYWSTSWYPLNSVDKGIEFYTSNALASSPASYPACSVSGWATTDGTITDCAVTQFNSSSFTRLRFRIATINNQGAWAPPWLNFYWWGNGMMLIDSVYFAADQFSSLNYVNEHVFDYYARWVDGFTQVNPTITTMASTNPFFFNSLVYLNGGLNNLNFGSAFFYSGYDTTYAANDGTLFPTVIRIYGWLTPAEQLISDRLLIFFNSFEPYDLNNPCFGPAGISCKYVAGGVENTGSSSMTDYSGSRRIEINVDLSQKFNIYIPVKVPFAVRNYGFFIATATAISDTATSQGIFRTRLTRRYQEPGGNGAYNWNVDTMSGSTPRISLTGNPKMGTVIDTSVTNMVSWTYVPGGYNTMNGYYGSHYGYCANYDFTVAPGFYFTPCYYNSVASPEQYCVTMKYTTAASRNMVCHLCPVHNSMSLVDIPIKQFTLPTAGGADFMDQSFVVGEYNGELRRIARDQQATALSTLILTHSIAFNPVDFKKNSQNVYVRLTITPASVLPQTIRINIIPTGASSSLLITPVINPVLPCIVNTLTTTNCAISGSDTNIQLDITSQDTTWPKRDHTIDFLVNAAGAASSISADTIVNYKVTLKVSGYTVLNVLHHDSTAQTYTVKKDTTLEMTLANAAYVFGNVGAITTLSFDFTVPSDILAYSNQKIAINLGTSGFKPLCRVYKAGTQIVSNDFSSCDATTLPNVYLVPKGPISGSYTIHFNYFKVPSGATTVSIKLYGVDGTTIVAQSVTSLALPTAPAAVAIPPANVVYDRQYSDVGEVGELSISIKPTQKDITNSTYMYVYFPRYYAPKLGYQNLQCTGDGLPLSCFLVRNRIIQITAFSKNVLIGTSVKVKIYGVITPALPVPTDASIPNTLFIGLAATDSLFTLTEQIEVTDKSPRDPTTVLAGPPAVPATLAFSVDSFTTSSTFTRVQADYTITFTTDNIGVRASSIIAIDFPDRQGSILKNQTAPLFLIQKVGDTVVTTVQSTIFGSRFKITLPLDLNPKTSYQFTIKNVWTPEQPVCNIDKPTIIVTTTEYNALLRSSPNIWNVPPLTYTTDTALKALGWTDSTGAAITSISLTIGVFSPEIWIVPPVGEKFTTDITFTSPQFKFLPTTVKAIRGTYKVALRLAPASTNLPSVVLLNMVKDEGLFSNAYSNLMRLPVTLTTTKVILPAKTIRIMKGSTSLPYGWDLDTLNMIPHTELKIDVAITTPATSALSVVGPSSITYSPTSPRGGFVFQLLASADPLVPPTFTLTLSGLDAKYYQLETATVTVEVLTPLFTSPVLSSVSATANYAPTKQQFSVQVDQTSSIFWHVAFENSLSTTDCLRIRSTYNSGKVYDPTSANQAQYGVFYAPVENVATLTEISNLMSNQRYSYILCPQNQFDVLGVPSTGTFQTVDNGASLYEVTLSFTSAVSRGQISPIACVFNQALQLPNDNVVAMDGTTCAAQTVFDNLDPFNYWNITLYISGDRKTDTTTTTGDNLNQYVTSIGTQTPSTFLTSFNQMLQTTSLTSTFQSITLKSGSTYSDPVIDVSATVTITTTDTTITFSGLALSSGPGVFFGVASVDTLSVPTYPQIKNKLNGKGAPTPGANAFYTNSPAQLVFKNLKPSTEYIIFYYASSNDRTQYAKVTGIDYVKAKTTASKIASGAALVETSLLLGLIMSFIAFF